MPKLLRLLLSIVAALSLTAALAACGDDDDAGTDDTTTTEPADEPTDEGEEASGPLCEGDAETVFPADGEAPAVDADEVTVTVTEDEAGGQTVYAFSENVTSDLASPGAYAVTLDNQGAEMHEMAIIRINDDETRTVAEILESGDEPSTFSTDVAFGSACPGQSSVVPVNIETPGRYVLACLFPVGSAPGLTEEEFGAIQAPPHAAQGMITEVSVS